MLIQRFRAELYLPLCKCAQEEITREPFLSCMLTLGTDVDQLALSSPPGPTHGLQGRADLGDKSRQPTPFSP